MPIVISPSILSMLTFTPSQQWGLIRHFFKHIVPETLLAMPTHWCLIVSYSGSTQGMANSVAFAHYQPRGYKTKYIIETLEAQDRWRIKLCQTYKRCFLHAFQFVKPGNLSLNRPILQILPHNMSCDGCKPMRKHYSTSPNNQMW